LLINAIHHPENAPDRIAKKLKRRLRLSTEQTAEVREILKKRQKALVAIFRKAQPKLERQLVGVREDVAAVLTPEQAKKWRWFFDSMKRKWVPSLRTEDTSEGS
jgi:Spy/CpxP family protein refolding chaperone